MKPLAMLLGMGMLVSAVGAQQSPFTIVFDTYRTGQYSEIDAYKTFVIKNQDQFEDYWYKSTGNPRRTAPADVNWLKNELLAVHLGHRPTGGYAVYVSGIRYISGMRYAVNLVEQVPSAGAIVTQARTSPFVIVRLPKRNATYELSKVVEEAPTTNPDPRPRPHRCNCEHCKAGSDCCCIGE